MLKKIVIGLAGVSVVAISVMGYIVSKDFFDSAQESDETNRAEAAKQDKAGDNRAHIKGSVTEKELKQYEADGLNPFGEDLQAEDLTDEDFQEYIHGMSHQKVRAEKKWGFYELHQKRVQWLLGALKNESDLNHKQEYKQILSKWDDSNFSSIDEDHNTIWRIQGGTVGKATGILSEEEEKAYLESQAGE